MGPDNKWSVEELIARYDLEPELLDVFVEGTFDRDVLTNGFSGSLDLHKFYEIDAVDVPDDLLAKHGLSPGNKQRVIALSREMRSIAQ